MNFFDAPTMFAGSFGFIAIADSLLDCVFELDVARLFPVGKRPT